MYVIILIAGVNSDSEFMHDFWGVGVGSRRGLPLEKLFECVSVFIERLFRGQLPLRSLV